MSKKTLRLIVLLLILMFIGAFKYYELDQYLTLASIKQNQAVFSNYYAQHTLQTLLIYFFLYVVTTALSLPGATILTLTAGALFGFSTGLAVVSFASSIGATLAFLSSRFLLRDFVQKKFAKNLQSINKGVEKDGAFYLFSLRLIPIFPFFVINLAMGLTKIKVTTFYIVSQVGMLLGTAVYVNAGLQLSQLESLSGILSLDLILSFSLLGIFPLLAKALLSFIKGNKVYKKYKRPKHFEYNMVVLGAGSAGLVTAYICSAVKAKVALIEKHKMGGDCLNTGCIPSKAMIRTAKVAHQIRHARKYGLESTEPKIDFKQVMGRVHRVIREIEPHDSVARYTELGVECFDGEAKIKSPWEVEVNGKILTTKNITIATGASPIVPKLPGIESITPLTSENLWKLENLPRKLIIVGGGPIGIEMAQSFVRLGSEVHLVELADRIMTVEDPEVSATITSILTDEGVGIHVGSKATEIIKREDKNYLIIQQGEEKSELEFSEILFAVGRRANVVGLGLEELGVTLRDNKTIEANEYQQTNFPNIYVCGDVTGPFQLTHTASHQAWYCAVNALFGRFKKFRVDYSVIPWATYSDPEVASVGLNETRAKAQGVDYELTTYGIDDLDRAIADSEKHGMVRVLTVPGTDKILGATIVGNHAADMLLEFTSAMKNNYGLSRILGTIHPYPTMGEANKYVAGNWKKVQTSERVFWWLARFHFWSRNGIFNNSQKS